jgi:hypothetical protein
LNSKNHNCLIISDGTEGMENQSMALAKSLGFKSNLLKAKPFWLCRLFPTFLAGRFKIPLSNNDTIFKTKNYTILITCGRRMAGISIGLKRIYRKNNKKIFTIHIQNPNIASVYFDLLVVPEHDNLTGKNIIVSEGSLHSVDMKNIKIAYDKLGIRHLKELKEHIVVLIGGNTRTQKLTAEYENKFISEIKRIQKIFKSKIVLCPSRRTPESLLKYFNLKKPEGIIIAAKKNNENPYPGIIYNAKFVIATTDSINLLSEAIGSGKEVFVLDLFKPVKRKKIYVKNLLSKGKIKYSDFIKSSNLFFNKVQSLNEAERISKLIKKRIK